jgi:hypothetical protein
MARIYDSKGHRRGLRIDNDAVALAVYAVLTFAFLVLLLMASLAE